MLQRHAPRLVTHVAIMCLLAWACGGAPPRDQPGAAAWSARLRQTLGPFSSVVNQPAFSPDSRTLATSTAAGSLELRRVSDHAVIERMMHPGGVTSIAFSPDGNWLASGGYDHSIRIWSVPGGALARTLAGHSGTVWSVAFSPDGLRLVTGGEDATVRVWRARDGALLQTLTGQTLNVWCVAFSPDGTLIASGSFDHTIRFWRADTGAPVRTLTAHTQAVVTIAFSPNGEWLASGGDDSTARIWRVRDGTLAKTLTGASNHVYSVAFSPDGLWLATAGRARGALGTLWREIAGERFVGVPPATIRLWRVSDGALQESLAEHASDVRFIAISHDGRWLASASDDRTVKVWELEAAR